MFRDYSQADPATKVGLVIADVFLVLLITMFVVAFVRF